jgi:hypothetical protein
MCFINLRFDMTRGYILCILIAAPIHYGDLSAQGQPSVRDSIRSGMITGIVRDFFSGDSLPGAIVALDTLPFDWSASADYHGRYRLQNVPPGVHSVKITFIGYERAIRKGILVSPGAVVTLDVRLRDVWYEQEDAAKEDLARGIVRLKIAGLVIGSIPDSTFTDKYGFRYELTGCIITGEDKYNAVMEKHLEQRNGKGWEERLNAEWQAYLKTVGRYQQKR